MVSAAKRFGRRLRRARLRAGFTQVDLATRLAMSQATLSRYEAGRLGAAGTRRLLERAKRAMRARTRAWARARARA